MIPTVIALHESILTAVDGQNHSRRFTAWQFIRQVLSASSEPSDGRAALFTKSHMIFGSRTQEILNADAEQMRALNAPLN
jgi:hypothetical protein